MNNKTFATNVLALFGGMAILLFAIALSLPRYHYIGFALALLGIFLIAGVALSANYLGTVNDENKENSNPDDEIVAVYLCACYCLETGNSDNESKENSNPDETDNNENYRVDLTTKN